MNFVKNYNELPLQLIEKFQSGNIFFSKEYEGNANYRKHKMYYLWDNNYAISIRIKKELFFQAGIFMTEPLCIGVFDKNTEKKFIDEVVAQLKKANVQWIICDRTSRFSVYPTGSKVVLNGNHIINLTLSEDELWGKVHSKHRNVIRRAKKDGVKIKIGGMELLREYVPIADITYARSEKKNASFNYYKSTLVGIENETLVVLAIKDAEVQAGGIFFYNEAIGYYIHGASKNEPSIGSANLLLWETMLHLKKVNVKEFSFVGYHHNAEPESKLHGIQRFKERFGGALEESYNFKVINDKFKYLLYCLVMQAKSENKFKKYQDAIDEQLHEFPELNKERG